MGMYSGIGSFAKKFQTGGEAETNGSSTNSGAPTGNLDDLGNNSTRSGVPLSFEEFVKAFGGNPGGLIGGVAADVAYQGYLQAFNMSGGNVDVTNGNISVRSKTLPSYMSFDDAGNIVFSRDTTNRQFIEGLNMLGLLSAEHSEGKTDYEWLLEWFDAGSEGAESSWLATHLLDPDRVLDFDKMYGVDTDLTAQNQATLRRLNDIVNNASLAGGFFEPSQTFRNTYADPVTVGQNYGDGTGASTSAVRPVFIGQPPTGGTAQQPYYSASDVLVSSSEQPNLYDRFNPYPVGDFKYYRSKNDPYQSGVTTNYGYQAPGSGISTSNLDALGTGLVFETEEADPVDPVVDEAEVVDTTQGTGGTGITVDESATTGTTDTAGPATTSTTDTVETTTVPTGPLSGYQNIAAFREEDPYLFGKRGMLSGVQALAGSRRDLTAEEFQSLISGQQGRYGEGSTLMYDPRSGIYSTISDERLQKFREEGAVPSYIDPRLMTKEERIRSNMMSGGTQSRVIEAPFGYNPDLSGGSEAAFSNALNTVAPQDPEVSSFYLGRGRLGTRIGDTQYFVNEDGSVTAYDVKDIEYGYTPSFANGGIVDVYDDGMVSMQTTGEGIESFLNPERSKATLRRNLAKLAPQPTAPVMQQGIMPMAR